MSNPRVPYQMYTERTRLAPLRGKPLMVHVVVNVEYCPFDQAIVNGGAKLVHPGGAKLVHLTLCGTRCWGVVPVVHRRDPRCFV